LRPIYTAATEAAAMEQFLEFDEVRVSATEIGKIVCTSNAIESVNSRIRVR
jgi:transposase-like protein